MLISVAGWMHQQQQFAVDYLREENQVLKEQLGGRRLRLNDNQRRRLAATKRLGRRVLAEVATIVTPDAVGMALETDRAQIRRNCPARSGRPRTAGEIEALMVRMAEKNREWGYRRILGALSNLGYRIPRGTAGRNLTDAVDRILKGKYYLIHDHDPLFTAEFLNMLAETGVKSVKLPPYSPNLNAYAERFVRSIKESCLERMIFFGERALHKGVQEFVAHYHGERNHQGPGNPLIIPDESHAGNRGAIRRRERLGGMLHYYNRQAA
jgi:transposase InsO family protein